MLNRYILTIAFILSQIATPLFAQEREIAITIDDLPFVGNLGKKGDLERSNDRFSKIVQALVEYQVPATGFVIGGSIARGQWALLEEFHNAGFVLGNHTYKHPSLNNTSASKYISEIERTDKILTPFYDGPKYFRYPFLAEGTGAKKEAVHEYLAENKYTIAPVTVDSKDYNFNAQLLAINWRNRPSHIDSLKKRYLAYIWKQTLRAEAHDKNKDSVQILLIHANLLNSHALPDILKMYKDNGYKFISLADALAKRESSEKESMKSIIPAISAIINHS